MTYSDSDDEHLSHLIPPTQRNKKKEEKTSLGVGVCTNRMLIIVLLACFVGASIYFQSELTELDAMLQKDESEIEKMQQIIRGHEVVIERFNNSVTNTDVLKQLYTLQEDMLSNKKELESELTSVQADISSQLKTTLNELGQTVAKAETEINNEVTMVKASFEEYQRTTQDQFSMENSFMIYQLAGTFTLLSCLISMWHMTAHLRKFNQPTVQRKILAILWMSPVYAITSWFSLVFHPAEGYLAIIKDFYEAYIIYQFLSFCIAVLGRGDRTAVVDLLAHHADHLSPPFRLDALCNRNPYDSDRALAEAVLLQCQGFAMQFVFFKPSSTIAMFVLEKMEYYGPTGNRWAYTSPQVYIVAIQNLSVFIAFTGLLKFYHAVDKDLAWCRPFAKFLCIKGVVFMTFWQGLAISILATTTDVGGQDQQEWSRSTQNFLVCLEMLLFSIAHFYTFPTDEWEEGYRASHEAQTRFGDSIALGDFFADLKILLKSQKKKKRKKDEDDMSTVAEGDDEGEDDDDDDDDDTTGASEKVRDIEKAVQKALASADDDVEEIAYGAAVSSTLQGQRSMHENEAREHIQQADEEEKKANLDDGGYGALMGHNNYNDDYLGHYQYSEETMNNSNGGEPNENTSLLGGGGSYSSSSEGRTANEEILRPSIFTTISDVARKSTFQ